MPQARILGAKHLQITKSWVIWTSASSILVNQTADKKMPQARIELATHGFSVRCSTNWATEAWDLSLQIKTQREYYTAKSLFVNNFFILISLFPAKLSDSFWSLHLCFIDHQPQQILRHMAFTSIPVLHGSVWTCSILELVTSFASSSSWYIFPRC